MQLSTPPLLRRQASRKWMLGTCSLFSPQTQAGCNLPTRKAQPGLYRSWVPKRSYKSFRSRYLSRALVPPAERDLHIQNGQPTCCANGNSSASTDDANPLGWRGRNTPAHEVYDPATNRWTALAYVPTARDHLAVAAMDGRLYAVGGRIDGNYSCNLTSNEAYDPATGRWEQRAPLPTARSGIAAAVLEGRMFVFGGEAPAGTFNQAEAYDAKSNGWSSHARMPTARHCLGAAAVAGRIYVISGGPTPGASASAANEIFVP
jgi:Kelch motif/Galactose oxidase, central domain